MHGCLWALVIAGAVMVVGAVGLAVLAVVFADDIENRTRSVRSEATITRDEFERVAEGMTLARVESIVGGEGQLMSSAGRGEFGTEMYAWSGDGMPGGFANISFRGGVVVGKAQFGLR